MPYIGKAPASGIRSRFIYTATAAQTTFTGADGNGKTLGYTDGEYVDVYLNGVLLDPADYTATSKTSVVLDSGATVSDIVEIVVYDTFSVFNGTFTGDLTVDGDTLFVDSTNNRVGVANASPSTALDVTGAVTIRDATEPSLRFLDTNAANSDFTIYSPDGENHLRIKNQSTDRVTIKSTGEVGIGTTSPASKLHIQDTGGSTVDAITLDWEHSTTTADIEQRIQWRFGDDASVGSFLESGYVAMGKENQWNVGANRDSYLSFATTSDGTQVERARIDSSGRVFIGNANNDVNPASTGSAANKGATFGGSSDPYLSIGRTGNAAIIAGRIDSDGDIALFYGDGTTVGQIGTKSNDMYIGTGDAGISFSDGNNAILPFNPSTKAIADNFLDLGNPSYRWDDIYITGSVVDTSDQNEKQQIASLTTAEITAAKEISKLFKTFKWNHSVEAKGDTARTHTGVMSQQVETALTNAGLNAADYAFWCSDTWWETQTDVPAVAAVAAQDAVLDDDGNIVTEAVEAVEAQDAYTRTDTYDTADEAPEGATERTRLGIRYSELLAFVGAATEQRLANIETRLTALEA